MDGAAVECRGLTKRYGAVTALADLDLDVPAGTVFGFLGPNGAGKTTTLRLLTGLARPSAGTATVAGVPVGSGFGGPHPIAFGYLDQDPRFYGWMRGRELLGLVADLHRLDRALRARRIGEALERVGLVEAADRRIGGYSGGMRQRLGLAAAMLARPPVLFLDEPVSALDPGGRHDLLQVISGLRGTTTVFMSTHILNDVERVCDRVGILDHGRLVADAPIDDLLARYALPVFRLDPEPGDDGALDVLRGALANAPWVKTLTDQDGSLRAGVIDPAAAGPALFRLIADAGVTLAAVERERPTLEDVFLRIVGEGSAP